jgi:putative ABC transport system substrate-binding protein
MKRREFITLLGGAAATWPVAARAQQAEGVGPNRVTLARIGYQAFSTELQKLGFTQGKNLQLDYLRTDQGMDLAVAAVRELVAAKANVIVATGPEISLRAALAPNSGLPIVILAHPGGTLPDCSPVSRSSP